MGVEARIVGGLFIVTYEGQFTTDEIIAAMARCMERPDYRPPMPLLVDTRGSRQSTSAQELERRAKLVSERPDLFGPRIAVVTSTPLQQGMTRQGSAYAENRGMEVRTFSDPDAAAAWACGAGDQSRR